MKCIVRKRILQISFGHFNFTGTFWYPRSYNWMPSTTAIAARYWMKTTGAVLLRSMACFMHTERFNDPAGDTHTLEPRPRAASWVVAVNVKPVGRFESSFAFLFLISTVLCNA